MAVTQYKDETKFASTKDVAAQINAWDATVVQCRSWRHPWDAHTVIEGPGEIVEIHQCLRCHAFRHHTLDARTGEPLTGWIPRLPEGYAMPAGMGRIAGPTLNMVRLAAVKVSAEAQRLKVKTRDQMREELFAIVRSHSE